MNATTATTGVPTFIIPMAITIDTGRTGTALTAIRRIRTGVKLGADGGSPSVFFFDVCSMTKFFIVFLLAMVLAPLAGCVVVERRDGYYFRPLLPYYRYPYRHYRPYYGHHDPRFDD